MAMKLVVVVAVGPRFLNPDQCSARPIEAIAGRWKKVAYEAEDFHRVVAGTGSLVSLCEAENGDDAPYAYAGVP
jgi:hypothetical protein